MKSRICFFIVYIMFLCSFNVKAENMLIDGVDAKGYILIEQTTGTVLCESEADTQLPIASVTKIMTMLLIMEAVDNNEIKLDDMVSVSENAMSYGGSTMFLEAGEELTVHDMLKGIAVASANDGCVAMAEFLSGSESAFVDKMNEKSKILGMENTHFMNTNGLDQDGHYSSARDVAIMSRELLNHPKITEYTSIWTDQLRDGKFELANTNKLIRFYKGANGLKTGSTSEALCCLSASAIRDEMQLIAVILGSPTSDKRFESAKKLLDYGFANYKIINLTELNDEICDVEIRNGDEDYIKAVASENKTFLCEKSNKNDIVNRVFINENLTAPIQKGDVIGYVEYTLDDTVIGKVDLVAQNDLKKKSLGKIINDLVYNIVK